MQPATINKLNPMRFAHLNEQIYCRPWFITSAGHFAIRSLFESHLARMGSSGLAAGLELGDLVNARQPLTVDADGVATVHVLGPVGKNLSKMEQACGSTSFESVQADMKAANADPAVKGILLRVDSPGGTVQGTPETAAIVAESVKPVVAYTEDVMASAAYYIAAGATKIVASRSADVGSIGVYIPWVDSSAAIAAAGYKPDPIVNAGGDLKAMGFGGTLSDAQRAYLQDQVDEDFAQFRAHILDNRTVPDSAMRGQTLSGQAAVDAGLVDMLGDIGTARTLLLSLR